MAGTRFQPKASQLLSSLPYQAVSLDDLLVTLVSKMLNMIMMDFWCLNAVVLIPEACDDDRLVTTIALFPKMRASPYIAATSHTICTLISVCLVHT